MTEHSAKVKQRAKEIAAEKWASKVKGVHIHRINSMYYEPEKNTLKTKNVCDIEYNDGRIERDGKEIVASRIAGDALVHEWEKFNEL